ncbi:MAG TPA: type II secretion system protein [Candidatus Acidoferrum sp.]|nr:type II secretion system protein [Candidatus Acidoferrum sp.]
MNRMLNRRTDSKTKREAGATLIELMIAMLILAIGLGGLTTLVVTSMATDTRNSKDTTATLLAQKVIEEVTAQNANAPGAIALTDCAGNVWTIPATQGLPAPNGQGAALMNNAASPFFGGIDFTQALGAVPAGFSMQWVDCDPAGQRTTYDVRWNVMTVTAGSTRMITASARRGFAATQGGGLMFAIPVTLRSIGGS